MITTHDKYLLIDQFGMVDAYGKGDGLFLAPYIDGVDEEKEANKYITHEEYFSLDFKWYYKNDYRWFVHLVPIKYGYEVNLIKDEETQD